jgi:hypothetical protein
MMEQVETAMCTEAIVPGMGWMAQRGHGYVGEFETATKATCTIFFDRPFLHQPDFPKGPFIGLPPKYRTYIPPLIPKFGTIVCR